MARWESRPVKRKAEGGRVDVLRAHLREVLQGQRFQRANRGSERGGHACDERGRDSKS